MVEIIITIVVICIIINIFAWLADLVGGPVQLIAIIAVFTVAFLAFSWVGVFCVIAIALLGFGILMVSAMLDEHDKRAKEVAKEQHKMQSEKIIHSNDSALMKELETGCMYLGYMDEKKWGGKTSEFQKSPIFNQFSGNYIEFCKTG